MQKYYVEPDAGLNNEYPKKEVVPTLEMAEGLVEVQVPNRSIQYFTRMWWMYKLVGNGEIEAPGNLPSIEIDTLLEMVDKQQSQLDQANQIIKELTSKTKTLSDDMTSAQQIIASQKDELQKSITTIGQLQQLTGTLTGQVTGANVVIKQLQMLAGQLTAQVAQITANQNQETDPGEPTTDDGSKDDLADNALPKE